MSAAVAQPVVDESPDAPPAEGAEPAAAPTEADAPAADADPAEAKADHDVDINAQFMKDLLRIMTETPSVALAA